jgi:exosortase C (VPDSG-CTERM-specific)
MPEPIVPPSAATLAALSPLLRRQLRLLAICTVVLAACFAKPLYALVRFTLHSDLYSHILLIPFVSLYLAWLKKGSLSPASKPTAIELINSPGAAAGVSPSPPQEERVGERRTFPYITPSPMAGTSEPDRKLAALPLAAGLLSILGYFFALHSGAKLIPVDSLAWTTLSFVAFFLAACFFCLGKPTLRAVAFPLAFLIFLVPFPLLVRDAIETFLQYRSADAAELLFGIAGTPLLRQDVDFQLPGFSLQVAPECSGIRSSLVLFITSLVAGQLFLRSPWKRAILALVIIPLGIFRNALRIVTIGELCVHIDPSFMDSPIHRRGGPVFFAISMVPFFVLLYYLRKSDLRKHHV